MMCVYTHMLLLHLHNYSNVYDIEIIISVVQSFISGFVMCPCMIHGNILVLMMLSIN